MEFNSFATGFLFCLAFSLSILAFVFDRIKSEWQAAKNSWDDATETINDFRSRIEKLKQENK